MKRHFTEEEVRDLAPYGIVMQGEDRRWSRTNTSIVNIGSKNYKLYYEHGLTEGQENSYEAQDAPEVKMVEKTVVIQCWEEIK